MDPNQTPTYPCTVQSQVETLPVLPMVSPSTRLDTVETIDLTATPPDERVEPTPEPEPDRTLGRYVGRYFVLRKLGEGGMGQVYAAYDEELDRRVAIKLLHRKLGASKTSHARMLREARAMARLSHPNVVQVHDVGMVDGQVFVAMEFVPGQTLRQWQAERDSNTDAGRRELLDAYIEAGRGLMAAHENGLIHRDFKPDNVIIERSGRARVLDFGLVAALESTDSDQSPDDFFSGSSPSLEPDLTRTGAMMGTPLYMAPEQFRAQATDARTDQFNFCASLYHALYREPPFFGEDLRALMNAVTEGRMREAPRGSTIPTWLHAVVVRGLAVSPDDRWPSMQALLDALADEPAQRRRRWGVFAFVCALIGGASWAVASAVQEDARVCTGMEDKLVGAWDDTRRGEVETAILASELSYAPATWTRVEQGLDAYASAWVAARTEACEATHRGEQSGELLDLRMACLDRRLEHLHATVDVLARADATVVSKASQAIAELPPLERCADIDALRSEVPPPEDPIVAERVSALEQQLVEVAARGHAGKYDEALRMSNAIATEAEQLGHEPLMAKAWYRQGMLQNRVGEVEAAAATLERAMKAALAHRMHEQAAHAAVSLIYIFGSDLAQPDAAHRWAVFADALSLASGSEFARAEYFNRLGSVAHIEANYDESRRLHERSLEILLRIRGANHRSVAATLTNLGITTASMGEFEKAREYYERALAIDEKLSGPEHPETASTLVNLADVAVRKGDADEAVALLQRGLKIWEAALDPNHPLIGTVLINLGNAAQMQGNCPLARTYLERATQIWNDPQSPGYANVGAALTNLGAVDRCEGKFEASLEHEQHALEVWEAGLGPEHPMLAYPLTGLGITLTELGRASDGLPHLERALTLRTTNPGDPTELLDTRFALAKALWAAAPGQGQDHERARELAALAEAGYAAGGPRSEKTVVEVRAWIAGLTD